MHKRAFIFGLILLILHAIPGTARAACDIDRPVVFADLNWDSNRLHTRVARFILEQGFGCATDTIPGATLPLVLALIRGDADVMMELWEEDIQDTWNQAEADGKVIKAGINYSAALQGWFIPRYLAEGAAKGLTHVTDLPRFKHLFRDPEEPAKGRFTNCPAGWGCENVNTRKLRAYGLDGHFTNFRTGTGAALDAAIETAFKRRKPILFYYWGPTWIMGKHDMVMLQEPPFDPDVWRALRSDETPAKACAYPRPEVEVALNKDFAGKAPTLARFFAQYRTSMDLTSAVLSFMRETDASTDKGARHFLKTQQSLWRNWVPDDVAGRVLAALD